MTDEEKSVEALNPSASAPVSTPPAEFTLEPPPYELAALNWEESRPLSKKAVRKSLSAQQIRPPEGQIWGVRHTQALLLFLCTSMAYSLRVILSVAIVAMVDHESKSGFKTFNWEKRKQSFILSSFFWGYLTMQVPASQLAQRFGAKLFLGGAMCGTGFFTLIVPAAAEYGDWVAVVAVRAASGVCQGFVFPCCYSFLGRWAPPLERGRLTAFVIGAQLLGPVVALPLTGLLATSRGGWPSVFYVFGAVGITVGITVWIFAASTPSEHKGISEAEKVYIERSIGNSKSLKAPRTPWLPILKSPPFWAAVVAHCGQSWGMLTYLTEIPTYMTKVLNFDIKSNGVLSAIPYLTTWLASFVFSWISDKTTEKKVMSLTSARKLYNSIGEFGPGMTMLALGIFQVSPTMSVVLLTLALGLKAGTYVGFSVNYVDLSPQFSGTLFGVGNLFAVSLAALAPITVGLIVTEPTKHDQWQYVFYVTAAMFAMGGAVFLLFGTADVQPWNGSRRPSLYFSKDSVVSEGIERLRLNSVVC